MLSGYIDLSKRRVSPEEVIRCEDKFAKAKAVGIKFEGWFASAEVVSNLKMLYSHDQSRGLPF